VPKKARKVRPTTTSRRAWLSGDLVMIEAKPLHLIRVKVKGMEL
jgi:hypothetical protein